MRVPLLLVLGGGWLLATVGAVQAKPTVDGTLTPGEYGPALFIQNTNTGFGDSTDTDPMLSNSGSEMDGIYSYVGNGRLYVLMTGNLEQNFNKWDLYIDSVPGGVNQFDNATQGPYPSIDPFSGGAFQGSDRLKFDAGFEADYYMTFTNGFETDTTTSTNQWAFTTHFSPIQSAASLPAPPSPQYGALGGNIVPGLSGGHLTNGTEFNPPAPVGFQNFWVERQTDNTFIGMEATIDNSNNAGVVDGFSFGFGASPAVIAAAAAVTTGIEFSIPLDKIGSPTGNIKISTFINGGSHNYLSNQVSGGVLSGNLGGDGAGGFNGTLNGVNFAAIAGDQFVTAKPALQGDVDFSGFVDLVDVQVVGLNWQGPGPAGDANGDGIVNLVDVQVVGLNWHQGTPPAGSATGVPEPSTLLLALPALLVALARRRGRRA